MAQGFGVGAQQQPTSDYTDRAFVVEQLRRLTRNIDFGEVLQEKQAAVDRYIAAQRLNARLKEQLREVERLAADPGCKSDYTFAMAARVVSRRLGQLAGRQGFLPPTLEAAQHLRDRLRNLQTVQ